MQLDLKDVVVLELSMLYQHDQYLHDQQLSLSAVNTLPWLLAPFLYSIFFRGPETVMLVPY